MIKVHPLVFNRDFRAKVLAKVPLLTSNKVSFQMEISFSTIERNQIYPIRRMLLLKLADDL